MAILYAQSYFIFTLSKWQLHSHVTVIFVMVWILSEFCTAVLALCSLVSMFRKLYYGCIDDRVEENHSGMCVVLHASQNFSHRKNTMSICLTQAEDAPPLWGTCPESRRPMFHAPLLLRMIWTCISQFPVKWYNHQPIGWAEMIPLLFMDFIQWIINEKHRKATGGAEDRTRPPLLQGSIHFTEPYSL